MLLGTRQDMDDIADAIEKLYENRCPRLPTSVNSIMLLMCQKCVTTEPWENTISR